MIKGSKKFLIDEKYKMLSDKDFISNLEIGVFSKDFSKISDFDWICEAVIENVKKKRYL